MSDPALGLLLTLEDADGDDDGELLTLLEMLGELDAELLTDVDADVLADDETDVLTELEIDGELLTDVDAELLADDETDVLTLELMLVLGLVLAELDALELALLLTLVDGPNCLSVRYEVASNACS